MKELYFERSAPAKLNLFLRVLERLDSGYHSLFTLFRLISLKDSLEIEITPDSGRVILDVQCNGFDVPGGEKNLVHRAVEAFLDEVGRRALVKVVVEKSVPPGAGLGGGSSDAANTLLTVNEALGEPMTQDELLNFSAKIGADCPFFVSGARCAIGTGIGERIIPFEFYGPDYYLLILSHIHVDTKWAYEHLMLTKSNVEISFEPEKLLDVRRWSNDLEAVVFKSYPALEGFKRHLIQEGAKNALMTGSGSSIFGVFSDEPDARKAKAALEKRFLDAEKAPRVCLVKGL